jgi:hypothetical protein
VIKHLRLVVNEKKVAAEFNDNIGNVKIALGRAPS